METSVFAENLCGTLLLAPHLWPEAAQLVRASMLDGPAREVLAAFEAAARQHPEQPPTAAEIAGRLSEPARAAVLGWAELVPRGAVDAENLRRCAEAVADRWTVSQLTARVMQALPGPGPVDLSGTLTALSEAVEDARRSAVSEDGVTPLAGCLVDFLNLLHSPPAHIPTGFTRLDQHIGGFAPGDLDVIAARSGAGKSDLALALAKRLAEAGHCVLYESLEMSRAEVAQRLVSNAAQVNSAAMRSRSCCRNEGMMADIADAAEHLHGLPLLVESPPALTVTGLEARVCRHKPAVVFVDNLDLLQPVRRCKDKWMEVEQTVHALKALAVRQSCCIVALVQLNRVADRDAGEPKLADLYGGASIEHDASVVLAMNEEKQPFSKTQAHMRVHVLKARAGRRGALDFAVDFSRHNWRETDAAS